MKHRAQQRSTRLGRQALGLSVLAAGFATATTLPAQAATPASMFPHVAVANDSAHTLANRAHETRYQDSFTVHQFGNVTAASARNQAVALSVGCSANDPCRSTALSFQIVTMAGENIHLNAVNLSTARNEHCDGCQTLAGAYQFIVSTPHPFTLSAQEQGQLAAIHHKLDALGKSTLPAADLKQQADALAADVLAVLKSAAATAPTSHDSKASNSFHPTVTMKCHFDGWPVS
ncbi:MAG: hypothetical protein JO362_19945 [Streptomycetaceae bacterium]|nr:hypothetical protein [Streptomycetaceae bacterium]